MKKKKAAKKAAKPASLLQANSEPLKNPSLADAEINRLLQNKGSPRKKVV